MKSDNSLRHPLKNELLVGLKDAGRIEG